MSKVFRLEILSYLIKKLFYFTTHGHFNVGCSFLFHEISILLVAKVTFTHQKRLKITNYSLILNEEEKMIIEKKKKKEKETNFFGKIFAVLAQQSTPQKHLTVVDLLFLGGLVVRHEYEQVVFDDTHEECDRHDGQEHPEANLRVEKQLGHVLNRTLFKKKSTN